MAGNYVGKWLQAKESHCNIPFRLLSGFNRYLVYPLYVYLDLSDFLLLVRAGQYKVRFLALVHLRASWQRAHGDLALGHSFWIVHSYPSDRLETRRSML